MTEIVVRSAKRNRLYVRKFDHDEARRRHAAGERVAVLATEYGVTKHAIYHAVTPEKKEDRQAAGKKWRTTTCEICGGPAMRLIGVKLAGNPDGRVLCKGCRSIEMRKRLRFDESGVLLAVRCASLDCANGERWQSPDNFAAGVAFRDVRPKGITGLCRNCNTRAKRKWRDARRQPCSHGCGTLVEAVGRRNPDKPLECRSCAMKRIHAERAAL